MEFAVPESNAVTQTTIHRWLRPFKVSPKETPEIVFVVPVAVTPRAIHPIEAAKVGAPPMIAPGKIMRASKSR
jgi:hypothetical protein